MKLIVAGSREFDFGYDFIDYYVRKFELRSKVTEVICGGATGIDSCGADWADMSDLPIKMFGADWETFGRSAGPKRNAEMAAYGDCLLLIWNGTSNGSANIKMNMMKLNKPVYEVIIKENCEQY